MRYIGLIKRILPFALTFAGGLFIASFFVPIGLSRPYSDHDGGRRNDCRRMKMRLQDTEAENMRLRSKIDRYESETPVLDQEFMMEGELTPVPPPPIAPVAPAAPHRHR